MAWYDDAEKFLTSSTGKVLVQQLAPKPAPVKVTAPVISVATPAAPSQGMSQGKMLAIGAGVLAALAVIFLVLRRK